MRRFLDDLRAFGINADQWTTAAQGEGEWRKTAERFMAKWIAAEKVRAELRHAVACPSLTGRTKDSIPAVSLAIVDKPQVTRTCILRAFGLQRSCSLSLVLRLLCSVQSFLDTHAPRKPHAQQLSAPFFVFVSIFSFLWRYRFYRVFLYVIRFFFFSPFRLGVFFTVTAGWIYNISLCENSTNSIKTRKAKRERR